MIVLGRDGTEVLLKIAEAGFAFPAVEIPRWERLAENLTAALTRDLGYDAVCLFTTDHSLEDGNTNGNHYEVKSVGVTEDAKTKRCGNQSAP